MTEVPSAIQEIEIRVAGVTKAIFAPLVTKIDIQPVDGTLSESGGKYFDVTVVVAGLKGERAAAIRVAEDVTPAHAELFAKEIIKRLKDEIIQVGTACLNNHEQQ